MLLPLTRRGIDILSPEERLDVARLGILQLLRGGATTVMEPFRNGIPEMFEAAAEMGLRFYGAPYLFSTSDAQAQPDGTVRYAGDDGQADLATWDALYERWHGKAEGRIGLAMSPHATDTCGPDLLRACAARARALDVPITTHLAQSQQEVATIGARHSGRTPGEYLDWLGLLGPDLLAAHCIASSDGDLRLMAARSATVLNCPRVFARTGIVAAFGRFAKHDVRTVVGTDGYNMDLLGELNAASMISKIAAGDPEAYETGLEMIAVSSTTPANLVVGVDTHKDVHAAVAISVNGVRLATIAVPASSKGYTTLEAWTRSMGSVQAFGIEGTGSYGAGLSRFLRERGHAVIEVNRPNRQLRYQKGKSDAVDAESAARAVLAGQADGRPKSGTGAVEMIRHLKVGQPQRP